MSSPQKQMSTKERTSESQEKYFMTGNGKGGNYSTPSLPEIKTGANGLNKSWDYSTNSLHNGLISGKEGPMSKRKRKLIDYHKFVSEEGTEMFNVLMEHKTSEIQAKMVSNRLKRLEMEEQRARDKIYKSRLKALQLQQQQDLKRREREFKQRWIEMWERDLDRQKRQNTFERVRVRQNIKELQKTQIMEKQNYKNNLKKTISKAHSERIKLNKEEMNYKKKLREKVIGDKDRQKSIRIRMQSYS
jgi:hypothetical protein